MGEAWASLYVEGEVGGADAQWKHKWAKRETGQFRAAAKSWWCAHLWQGSACWEFSQQDWRQLPFQLTEHSLQFVSLLMASLPPHSVWNVFLRFTLFIFGCTRDALAVARRSCCLAFSLQRFLWLWSTGSKCAGFSSWRTQAWLLLGMWDLPGPGIEPTSPALAGRFLTTRLPGKPWKVC